MGGPTVTSHSSQARGLGIICDSELTAHTCLCFISATLKQEMSLTQIGRRGLDSWLGGREDRLLDGKKAGKNGWKCLGGIENFGTHC